MTEFADLIGTTLAAIEGAEKESEQIIFTAMDGKKWSQYHSQDCCESVSVEDVIGDVGDLIGSPILLAEEVTYAGDDGQWPEGVAKEYEPESYTWTFYKLATIKGSVTIRWFGESNGYYSESVSFAQAA